MTQAQLSERSKLSRRTIIRWEAGEASPWIPELRAAIQALGITDKDSVALLSLLDTTRRQRAFEPQTADRYGRIFRMARIRANLTSADIATAMGCNPSTVARWESGRLSPRIEELIDLWPRLGVEERELEELGRLDAIEGILNGEDLEERILGILWPWDNVGYRLFDIRFSNLIEVIERDLAHESRLAFKCRAKTAYAWMLASCARFIQAKEHSDEVIRLAQSGEMPSEIHTIVAALISAKCSYRSLSKRAVLSGIRTLDELENRPLGWELLACRLSGYGEAFACQGSFVRALEYCDRAIDAASKCGPKLSRLFRFNRCRALLMAGEPQLALESLPEFSELTPLNDANEALAAALIYEALGHQRQARHWMSVANEVIGAFQLDPAFSRQPGGAWSTPALFSLM
jgi:transcriptional regulator with XRE-family HTH domain